MQKRDENSLVFFSLLPCCGPNGTIKSYYMAHDFFILQSQTYSHQQEPIHSNTVRTRKTALKRRVSRQWLRIVQMHTNLNVVKIAKHKPNETKSRKKNDFNAIKLFSVTKRSVHSKRRENQAHMRCLWTVISSAKWQNSTIKLF